ncbi:MerR family DNA-binding protein [Rhodococcus erythropolis]|uniref:MerR family DNA-binding protein n=1 Tax=Rhodococcus erythropolis TaxID=1833 RepID=UPI0027E05756|nr:MerR family DNA-binding protein [Rhodococcus erythropolis]
MNELLHLAGGGPDDCDTVRRLAQTKTTGFDEKIRDLQRMRASLAEFASTCARPQADRHCPILQTLHTDKGRPRCISKFCRSRTALTCRSSNSRIFAPFLDRPYPLSSLYDDK